MSSDAFRPERPGPETTLQDAVVAQIPGILGVSGGRLWLGISLPVGAGLPDILAATYSPRVTEIGATSNGDLEVMAYLRVAHLARVGTIASRLNRSPGYVASSLDRLCECGIVHTMGQAYTLDGEWRSVLPEVAAVEVKVSDWRKGIAQASRNQLFAHRSFLALPQQAAHRLKRSTAFTSSGVGLIGIDGMEVEVLRNGIRHSPRIWQYYYHVARAVARNRENRDGV